MKRWLPPWTALALISSARGPQPADGAVDQPRQQVAVVAQLGKRRRNQRQTLGKRRRGQAARIGEQRRRVDRLGNARPLVEAHVAEVGEQLQQRLAVLRWQVVAARVLRIVRVLRRKP